MIEPDVYSVTIRFFENTGLEPVRTTHEILGNAFVTAFENLHSILVLSVFVVDEATGEIAFRATRDAETGHFILN